MKENQMNKARTLLQKFNQLWNSSCITLSRVAECHEEADVNDFRQEVNDFLENSHLGVACDHCDEEVDDDCECEFCDTCDEWVGPGEPCISCDEDDEDDDDDWCHNCEEYPEYCECDDDSIDGAVSPRICRCGDVLQDDSTICKWCHRAGIKECNDPDDGVVSPPLNAFQRARLLNKQGK